MEEKNNLFRKSYEINEEEVFYDDDFVSLPDGDAFSLDDLIVYCGSYAKFNDVKYGKVSSIINDLSEKEKKISWV